MAKKETIEIEKFLRESFQQRRITINKIVIFGSYARREERQDSDIDIIIVSKDFRDKDIFERVKLTNGIHRELVKKIMKPLDIMYYSDIEWNKSYSLIINTAKQEGEIIYSK